MYFKRKFIAAAVVCIASFNANAGGIPVADGLNLSQNIQNYIENLAQGVQQLADYTLQLKQYENELLRYQELVDARQLPGAYLYDTVFDASSEARRTLEFGGRLAHQFSNLEDYAKSVVNGANINPCGEGGCSESDLRAGAMTVQNSLEKYNQNLRYDLVQSRKAVEQMQNNADDRQRALMNQIRSSRSQVQSMHAGAQASAAVAEAVTTQTIVMQQLEHNEMVRKAQAAEAAKLAHQQTKNLMRFTKTGNTNYQYWDGETRRLYNLNPSLSWK